MNKLLFSFRKEPQQTTEYTVQCTTYYVPFSSFLLVNVTIYIYYIYEVISPTLSCVHV